MVLLMHTKDTHSIIGNVSELIKDIPHNIRLIAASKTRSTLEIEEAYKAGIENFGENYIKEAAQKIPNTNRAITWHLIGHFQSNKVNQAVGLFDVFHTIDSTKLTLKLDIAAQKANKTPDIYLQVNIGREPQKGGVLPEELPELIEIARKCNNLSLIGLMAIPPAKQDPTPYFKELKKLAEQHQLPRLSMGMSADWQQAVSCGATDIRVGTTIFGVRKN